MWHRPDRQITGMSFYGFKIWHRRLHGLYRARRRCSRGRFATLIPVGLAHDIPFTRPCAAMPAPNKPSRKNVLCGTILLATRILFPIKRLNRTKFSVMTRRLIFKLPQEKQGSNATMWTPSAPRIRTLQQAPFADFAAEDLVQRSHGRAGGRGFEEAEET